MIELHDLITPVSSEFAIKDLESIKAFDNDYLVDTNTQCMYMLV